VRKQQVVTVTEFKAKCLAYLDDTEQRGETIMITKRGRPLATLGPVKKDVWKSPRNSWASNAKIVGDIISPGSSSLWDALSREADRT
jgi:prevent-host-death family protein